jgi:hypothetical protein
LYDRIMDTVSETNHPRGVNHMWKERTLLGESSLLLFIVILLQIGFCYSILIC